MRHPFQFFRSFLARRHTVRAHFWQTLANYTQTAGGMLIGILLARMLSPAVFGEFVLITSLITFLMIPLSFSPAQLLVSDCGRTPQLFERVMGMTWLVTACKLLTLLCYIVWALINNDLQAACVGLLVGLPTALSDWANVIKSDLEGRGLFKPNFIVQIVQVSTHAGVTIGLVWAGWGIYGLALGGFAAFLPSMAVYLASTDRRFTAARFDKKIFWEQFRSGFWLWLSQTSEALFSRIDKIFLGLKGTNSDLGYYNRALNFAPVSQMALNSLLANATVVGLAKQTSVRDRNRLFLKTSFIVFTGAVANWAVWWWFSDPLVVWIFGNQWAGAIECFEAFSWLSLAYGIVYLPTTMLLAKRRYRDLALCRLGGLILFMILLYCLYLTGEVTAVHVAYSFLTALFVMGSLIGYMTKKKSPDEIISA